MLRSCRNRLRDAVRRENHRSFVRNLVELVDEHRAEPAQPVDDEAVVQDLVAHVDGRSETLERQLDDLDRPIDPGAEASRRCNEDPERRQWAVGFRHGAGHVRHRLQA